MFRVEGVLSGKGVVERTNDGLLDFRTAESLTGRDERRKIKALGLATAAMDMDAENFLPFFWRRQVDKKDFVEAPLAKEFRGQMRDIIGRGHDEDRGGLFRQPGQKRPQDAGGGAGVG